MTVTIVTRTGKGSPLTNNEVDANFNNLNNGKQDSVTANGLLKANGSGVISAATSGTDYTTPTGTESLSNKTITAVSLKETKVAMAANAIDLSLGNVFTKTFTSGAVSITVSNVPSSGTVGEFILEATNAGLATITWPTGSKWAGGTAPTLTSSGVDVIGGYSHDGGTTWRLFLLAKDSK